MYWKKNKTPAYKNVFHFIDLPLPPFSLSLLIATMARKNKGRQRIEMTRMSKESNLLVTFSKRRSGLFKKASELCTLCGAEIAIVVFSPGKKAFSFGHPSVGAIVDRFLSRTPPPPRGGSRVRQLKCSGP